MLQCLIVQAASASITVTNIRHVRSVQKNSVFPVSLHEKLHCECSNKGNLTSNTENTSE